MHFIATADTDVGIQKDTNQDSVLIKHASVDGTEVLMAIICDGMGGLAKGELASATVVREFSRWFDQELPVELAHMQLQVVAEKWALMLRDLNMRIREYGGRMGANLGTTFSGILFYGSQYMIVHVGDTRIYSINNGVTQLTTDHTFIAREISRGTMTVEQAKVDKRRNLLLQCVGASKVVEPQIIYGTAQPGAYLICSDGFRHEISPAEIYESLNPINLMNKNAMHSNVRYLIEQVKSRGERDNISAVLIKAQ